MQLKSPFLISSRLLPAIKIGGAAISVEFTGNYTRDNREIWQWFVDLDTGEEFTGADLNTGCGASFTPQSAMENLLSFMGACAESIAYGRNRDIVGENADLFPEGMHAWLVANSDEISMMQLELEEKPGQFVIGY